MVIRIGSKPNFLYFRDFAFSFHLFFLSLLIVKEFVVINNLTNRGIDCRGNFYQVQRLVLCHFQCNLGIKNTGFYIVANQPNLRHPDKMIDTMLCFFAGCKSASETAFVKSTTAGLKAPAAWWSAEPASGFLWYCHLFFLVNSHPVGSIYFFIDVLSSGS